MARKGSAERIDQRLIDGMRTRSAAYNADLEGQFARALQIKNRTELAHTLGALADILLAPKPSSGRLARVDALERFQRAYRADPSTPKRALKTLEG